MGLTLAETVEVPARTWAHIEIALGVFYLFLLKVDNLTLFSLFFAGAMWLLAFVCLALHWKLVWVT